MSLGQMGELGGTLQRGKPYCDVITTMPRLDRIR